MPVNSKLQLSANGNQWGTPSSSQYTTVSSPSLPLLKRLQVVSLAIPLDGFLMPLVLPQLWEVVMVSFP